MNDIPKHETIPDLEDKVSCIMNSIVQFVMKDEDHDDDEAGVSVLSFESCNALSVTQQLLD